MQGASPDFSSNPTSRRLGWIRKLFFEHPYSFTKTEPGARSLESRGLVLEPGMLLVAPPMVHDLNFRRSVVLLCEHSPDGSFGLVLNHRLSVNLGDVLPELAGFEAPVGRGGPVQTDTLHFIHRRGEDIPGAIAVAEGVYWGGDFEILKLLIQTEAISPADIRFFLGYAGWAPGQLEGEMDQGGWIIAADIGDVVFDIEAASMWRSVLRTLGGEYAVLSNFPEDPRLN